MLRSCSFYGLRARGGKNRLHGSQICEIGLIDSYSLNWPQSKTSNKKSTTLSRANNKLYTEWNALLDHVHVV